MEFLHLIKYKKKQVINISGIKTTMKHKKRSTKKLK